MDYSFNAHIAEQYGVEEAVFIHNLYWWISKNKANGQHFYEGRTWTYNSAKAFADLFPFWTPKQIRRIIKKLEAEGALHIGNFNDNERKVNKADCKRKEHSFAVLYYASSWKRGSAGDLRIPGTAERLLQKKGCHSRGMCRVKTGCFRGAQKDCGRHQTTGFHVSDTGIF